MAAEPPMEWTPHRISETSFREFGVVSIPGIARRSLPAPRRIVRFHPHPIFVVFVYFVVQPLPSVLWAAGFYRLLKTQILGRSLGLRRFSRRGS